MTILQRREFIAGLGGATARPLAARAQQGDRVRRIGWLLMGGENDPLTTLRRSAFTRALADLSWTEGRNVRIDLRSAGGLVFSALQDGWVVAYDDETLEELWRFNVGTPLKGAPVTYAIGPKQYLAVQASGRHLHPVKYDNLETSSYLFVFSLN
jgi:hypothetical protein